MANLLGHLPEGGDMAYYVLLTMAPTYLTTWGALVWWGGRNK